MHFFKILSTQFNPGFSRGIKRMAVPSIFRNSNGQSATIFVKNNSKPQKLFTDEERRFCRALKQPLRKQIFFKFFKAASENEKRFSERSNSVRNN